MSNKKKDYKVTFESTVYIGKTMFMGSMVDTSEGRNFEYTFNCESKDDAIELAQKEHTLPINKTRVIELNAKYSITTTMYKYGEKRETELETFDTKDELNAKYKEYLEYFKVGRRCPDKWMMEVVSSDGRTRMGKIDC